MSTPRFSCGKVDADTAGTSGYSVRRGRSHVCPECKSSLGTGHGNQEGNARRKRGRSLDIYFRSHGKEQVVAMDVKLAVLADYAIVSQDSKLSILGIFQEVQAPFLPFSLPQMYLVVSFEAEPEEYGEKRLIRIALLDGNGDSSEILAFEGLAEVPQPTRPGGQVYVNQVIGLNGITFERPGDYKFSISVEGEEKKIVLLPVHELQ